MSGRDRPLSWEEFLARRTARWERSVVAADALRQDDPAPAAALLEPWQFAADRPLVGHLLASLTSCPPQPDPRALAAARSGDAPAPPRGEWQAPEWFHRVRLSERISVGALGTEAERIAWSLSELAFLGSEIERVERDAWRRETWATDPRRDARMARIWTSWLDGKAWGQMDAVEAVLLPAVHTAFRGAMERHRVPKDARSVVLGQVREQLFVMLMGPKRGLPGMLDVAARVLESAPAGPLVSLARWTDEEGWDAASRCVACRGEWAGTVRSLLRNVPDTAGRALALRRRFVATPAWLEPFTDFHTARRLLSNWTDPTGTSPEASWAVVTQNRGRVRARMRSLVARIPPRRLSEALLELDSLHARTLLAVGRFAWDWARHELSRHFPMGANEGITPDCRVAAPGVTPLTPEETAIARTWVLKCILRNRGPQLLVWIRTGGTRADRETKWGQLLTELPSNLRDDTAREARYARLRAHLSEELHGHLEAARSVVASLLGLPDGRGAAEHFRLATQGTWSTVIPEIKAGFPTLKENVPEALAWVDDLLAHPEDPWLSLLSDSTSAEDGQEL